jgi:hypothetical protein
VGGGPGGSGAAKLDAPRSPPRPCCCCDEAGNRLFVPGSAAGGPSGTGGRPRELGADPAGGGAAWSRPRPPLVSLLGGSVERTQRDSIIKHYGEKTTVRQANLQPAEEPSVS